MNIQLTKSAAEQIKKSAQEGKMEGMALRVAVMRKPSGEFHYALGFDNESHSDDITFKSEGVPMVVSGDTLLLTKEMKIDFVEIKEGEQSFIFLNPNDPAYTPPQE
ncbi:MAG: HesB/IscA family protein [Candidatus Oxydemutatoraceae bacterium WSBS_2016_MAG_OTU14]